MGAHRAERDAPRTVLALAAWATLIVACAVWGGLLNASGANILLGAPPLFGSFSPHLALGTVLSVFVAAAVVICGPALARALSWRRLLLLAPLATLVWAITLAGSADGVTAPLENPGEYLTAVPLVGSPGEFLSTFTERIDGYATHVRSHPPGMVLVLWVLEQAGLGGSAAAALLTLLVAASALVAVLITARVVVGEAAARRTAPFLILVPGAVWIATTADAFFMGVVAWAIASTTLAVHARGRRSDGLAFGGGVLFAAVAMLSYGLVLLAMIPLAQGYVKRHWRPLLIAGGTAGALGVAILLAGYSWIDGFFAIREQYLASIARTRPYEFFVFNNLAAFALAAGPAVAVGLALMRERRLAVLVGSAALALLIADLSGMSKAEVERIWLPFLPWIVLATAALPASRALRGGLLASQAALAIAIQISLETIW